VTGVKRQGREANHSRPSSAETENYSTCSSIPHNILIPGTLRSRRTISCGKRVISPVKQAQE